MTTSTDAVPLKPCHFCGSEDLFTQPALGRIQVVCETCEASGPTEETDEEAVEAWNRRAPASEVQADHIADERKMVAADLYLWLAGSNDNRFIRAWTNDPDQADRLRKAIGLEPTRYCAAPASYVGDQEVGS